MSLVVLRSYRSFLKKKEVKTVSSVPIQKTKALDKDPEKTMAEEVIEDYLNANNIDHFREYTFHYSVNGHSKSSLFDFYIPNYNNRKIVIEIDGKQHYNINNSFNDGSEEYKKKFANYQNNDRNKTWYILSQGIRIARIRAEDMRDKRVNDKYNNVLVHQEMSNALDGVGLIYLNSAAYQYLFNIKPWNIMSIPCPTFQN